MAEKFLKIGVKYTDEAGNQTSKSLEGDAEGNLGVMMKGKVAILHTGTTATGGGLIVYTPGMASGTIRVSGTFAAILSVQGRMSPSFPWIDLPSLKVDATKSALTITSAGVYQFDTQGMSQVRLAVNQYTSGSISAEMTVKPFGHAPLTQTIANDKFNMEVSGSRTARLHTAATSAGSGVVASAINMGSGSIVLSGTFVADMNMQGRVGTSPWTTIPVVKIDTGEVLTTSMKTSGAYSFSPQAFTEVRLGINQVTSGSITADLLLEPYATQVLTKQPITTQPVELVSNKVKPEPVLPVAFPERDLEMVDVIEMGTAYGQVISSKSVGYDDGVIYAVGGADNKLVKISNGFETKTLADLEFGYDFSTNAGFVGSIAWVEKTFAGFVVVETIAGSPNTSAIWFSENFESGFEKVLTLDRGRVTEFNFTAHHGGPYNTVLMASEYPSNISAHTAGQEPRLFLSLDGGLTWQLIRTLEAPVGSNFNNHIHTQVYDQYDARIYLANGDGDNSKLAYSDDLGATWKIVPLSSYTALYPSHHPQPTLMISTPNKIVMSHDNGLPGGILSLIKNKKYTAVNGETFSWSFDYAAYPSLSGAAGKFGFTYVQRGKELYIVIPTFQTHKQVHIIGSGDGGNTFYSVASLNLTQLASNQETRQLTGIDKNGFMYLTFGTTRIAKYKPAVWLRS